MLFDHFLDNFLGYYRLLLWTLFSDDNLLLILTHSFNCLYISSNDLPDALETNDKFNIIMILDELSGMSDIMIFYYNKSKVIIGKEITFMLIKFSYLVKTVMELKPLNGVENLTESDYIPNGYTVLNDSIGMFKQLTFLFIKMYVLNIQKIKCTAIELTASYTKDFSVFSKT